MATDTDDALLDAILDAPHPLDDAARARLARGADPDALAALLTEQDALARALSADAVFPSEAHALRDRVLASTSGGAGWSPPIWLRSPVALGAAATLVVFLLAGFALRQGSDGNAGLRAGKTAMSADTAAPEGRHSGTAGAGMEKGGPSTNVLRPDPADALARARALRAGDDSDADARARQRDVDRWLDQLGRRPPVDQALALARSIALLGDKPQRARLAELIRALYPKRRHRFDKALAADRALLDRK